MRKIAAALLLTLLCVLSGCATGNPAEPYAGVYKSRTNDWQVTIYRDGAFEYAFWPTSPDGSNSLKGNGYCDFAVSDPSTPELTVYLSYMQDKFSFVFSPDRKQLAVLILLPDESRIVAENGKQVLLYRVGEVNTDTSLLTQ